MLLAALALFVVAFAGGCGGDEEEGEPDGVAVVRQFEEALSRNDNAAAAGFLADGAVLYGEPVPPGGGESAVRGLSCEAEIESIEQSGDTVTAELRFTGTRESAAEECPAAGGRETTLFTVRNGRITEITD